VKRCVRLDEKRDNFTHRKDTEGTMKIALEKMGNVIRKFSPTEKPKVFNKYICKLEDLPV
jgi:hypothetical protein